jgi:hypothetical protein
MKVSALFLSTGVPHEEQKRPLEETCAPQEEQNIGGRDSTIGAGPERVRFVKNVLQLRRCAQPGPQCRMPILL